MRTLRRAFTYESLEGRRMFDGSGLAAGEPQPSFDLVDVNSTSPTFNQEVSPGDFSGTTAYYFIHST